MISVHLASMLDWLDAYDGPLFDSCVTDPPYHLTSIVKRFGGKNAAEAKIGATGAYARAAKGFMGKEWDGGDIAFRPETWRKVYDALKPGAHLVAFSGTRTYHRMACAIEDAGFEIRDQLAWMYGSGFAKSHNLKRQPICSCKEEEYPLPKAHGKQKAKHELRFMPSANLSPSEHNENKQRQVLQQGLPKQGSSQLRSARAKPKISRVEQSCVEGGELYRAGQGLSADIESAASEGKEERLCFGAHLSGGNDDWSASGEGGGSSSHRSQQIEQQPGQSEDLQKPFGALDDGTLHGRGQCPRCGCLKAEYESYGTALKPAWEPICLARKPLSEKSIAANVLKHGTGALNIDGCRIEGVDAQDGRSRHGGGTMQGSSFQMPDSVSSMPAGRWPANVAHDGSDEVLAGFPETGAAKAAPRGGTNANPMDWGNGRSDGDECKGHDDKGGSAARFFYSAKAGPLDRIGSAHATVKPVDLMRWLVRMVTPPGGHVLEPFAGSGKTGIACMAEGFDCTMIDNEADHVADIERQLAFLRGEGALKFEEHNHAKSLRSKPEPLGGLFSGNMEAPTRNAEQVG